ncbi:MAG: hypothetical protein C0P72_012060 [Clostridia bacterium]
MNKQHTVGRYPLRIHPGWSVVIHGFMEWDPLKVSPDDEGKWLSIFTEDIFYIHYDEKYGLDLGWYPEADPKGEFVLQLVTHKDFEPLLTIETRNLHEIADAIDKITWGVSQGILPSSDSMFSLEQINPPIRLQPLKVHYAWKIEKNRFIEMDWKTAGQQEIRDYLTDDLLLLKDCYGSSNKQIHLGWKPAGDPQGRFVLEVADPDDKKQPLRTYSTRSVEEVVDWIEKACIDEL